MSKIFSLSFQHKVTILLLLLMNIPFFITGYFVQNLTEDMIMREKRSKLLSLAHVLSFRLGASGFAGILTENGSPVEREEQIKVLNHALQGVTDEISRATPGLGIGFYSRELDAIITYGPSELFINRIGRAIASDHPGHEVMEENKEIVQFGKMVRGEIMNAMVPIERNGEIIGYVWANELAKDVAQQITAIKRSIYLVLGGCLVLTMLIMLVLSRRTVSSIDKIVTGVRGMRSNIDTRIADVKGDFAEVATNINQMAEEIATSKQETDRVIAIFQNVLSNVDAAVLVCDPETKQIVYANNALSDLYDGKLLSGETCYKALYDNDEQCDFCPQKKLFDAAGNPTVGTVQWEQHHDKKGRDFLLTDRLVTWHDGRIMHMEVATDITERKALVVAESAAQAQKDFLARMSHEIRTPMNGVLGMTRLAINADPPPTQLEYLKKIQSSASLLLGIINDILDFSRIEAGKLSIESRVFNLKELVANIRELIMPRIQENDLVLVINLAPSVPDLALGDELRLSQILLNLLGNASKFTLEGSVTLDMATETLSDGRLRLSCAVTDSGIGMTMEQQEALFKPFSQADSSTSRKFGGTGLGLSISKALVELMGGEISVSSEDGKGSTFSFYITLDPASAADQNNAADEERMDDFNCNGRNLLLVEDNIINQEIAIAVLEDLGATVEVANNGEEAITAFMAKDYDAILMDVRMPVMDGLEATRGIRASKKHDAKIIPIIAMTANAMQEDRQSCTDAGMNGHIAKPFDVSDLKKVLRDQLNKS